MLTSTTHIILATVFALVSSFASAKVTHLQYSSRMDLSPSENRRYFLTERVEDERFIFSLFMSVNGGLQDLVWEKSFSTTHQKMAQIWLKKMMAKYELTPSKPPVFPKGDFYSLRPKTLEKNTPQEEHAPGAVLWKAENEWSSDWEKEYGHWASRVLTPSFMVDINMPTDCADVAYTMRFIFSYLHKLPMAFRLAGSGQLFTNETMTEEWEKLPTDPDWKKDLRLRAAIQFVNRNTYTHTLMADSYPIGIDTDHLTPGAYHLSLFEATGHTMLIHKVNDPANLPITLLSSTVPAAVRELMPSFYQETADPVLSQNGFYKIRWAKKTQEGWQILPAKSIPDYSEEQFHLPSDDSTKIHFLKVYKKLNPNFSFLLMLEKGLEEFEDRLIDRIKIVEEGFLYCQTHDCSPGTSGDEDWSTPSRDKKLVQIHGTIATAMSFVAQTDPEALKTWKVKIAQEAKIKKFNISGALYSLNEVLTAFLYNLTESDPRVSVAERWGVSLEGYSKNLGSYMHSTLALRTKLIDEAEECRQSSCSEPGERYKALNTFSIDKKMRTRWNGARLLCALDGKDECPKLNRILKAQTFNGKNLLFYLENESPRWISSPNADKEKRWGVEGLFLLSPPTDQGMEAFFTEDRQWFTYNGSLYKTSNTDQPIALPPAESLGQLHYTAQTYFTYKVDSGILTIKIYQLPGVELATFSHPYEAKKQLRLWWSGRTKKTLSIFLENHFYEMNLQGKVVKHFPYKRFFSLASDTRITFIETKSGLFFSDAEKEAAQFTRFPLPEADIQNISFLNRHDLGWSLSFNSQSRIFYFEPSGLRLDWENYPAVNKSSTFAARSDGEKTVELYRREKTIDGKEVFRIAGVFKGQYFTLVDSYLSVYYLDQVTTYSLPSLDPVSFSCDNPKLKAVPLYTHLYLCNDENSYELHHSSGRTLRSSPNSFERVGGNIEQGQTQWFMAIKSLMTAIPTQGDINDGQSFIEYYSLTPQGITGPFLQDLSINNFGFFSYGENIEPITRPKKAAPPLLGNDEWTNYGFLQATSLISSPILNLNEDVKKLRKASSLFVPKL